MTGFVDRERATDLMQRAGIEALVLCEPEAFQYATGAWIGPAGLFRRAGAGFVVIPKRGDLPIGVVVADFQAARLRAAMAGAVLRTHAIWIESASLEPATADRPVAQRIEAGLVGRAPGFSRPATFELARSVRELKTIFTEFGLERATLGIELDFVSASDFSALQAMLPGTALVNGSPVLDRLRAIKSQSEIDLLQQGIALSEAGLSRLQQHATTGMRQSELVALYRQGVADAAAGSSQQISTAEYVTLGARPKGADAVAGDPLKADMVCSVNGYASDMSRNFTFGPPSPEQAELHAIAERAFADGLVALMPGKPLAAVHRAASESLARQGLRSYRRGHFGHGVGNSVFSEQWPFISADSTVVIEAGMVLAFEIPLYIDGLASFNLEDQFLITANGPSPMNRLPRRLDIIA
ncbi:Xaa-Pro peptidase family protein [Mesorhizobium sp. M0814]|uniref:Xaa-Pro peptidase family protein n=1 Tax=unclassified Mesorhizobium TaxID=325217 RepID=UPI003334D520